MSGVSAQAWPRSAKLDAPRLVDRIAEITGVRLVLEGPCPGGEVGAAYVRWPDGRRSVLSEGSSRTGPVLDLARAAGVPTARQELSAHIDGVRVIVQQRLPGIPPATVDAALVHQMVAINDRLSGLLADPPAPDHGDTTVPRRSDDTRPAGRPHSSRADGTAGPGSAATPPPHRPGDRRSAESPPTGGGLNDVRVSAGARRAARIGIHPVELYLTGDGPGYCLHEPLARYSSRTARLLAWVREVGAAGTPAGGDDLVHLDFTPANVLVSDGRVTGVIDWDGASRGDRHLDLVVLRFSLLRQAPRLAGIVDERLASADPDRLRAYWAHISLRQVDWSIRHHDAAAVDQWLDIAELGMR